MARRNDGSTVSSNSDTATTIATMAHTRWRRLRRASYHSISTDSSKASWSK